MRTHTIQAINHDELKLTITIKQNYLIEYMQDLLTALISLIWVCLMLLVRLDSAP